MQRFITGHANSFHVDPTSPSNQKYKHNMATVAKDTKDAKAQSQGQNQTTVKFRYIKNLLVSNFNPSNSGSKAKDHPQISPSPSSAPPTVSFIPSQTSPLASTTFEQKSLESLHLSFC
jgi:hypothetical protein